MNPEFVRAVRTMREAQKTYFTLRKQHAPDEELFAALKVSKDAEREVDGWLKSFAELEQQSLFASEVTP